MLNIFVNIMAQPRPADVTVCRFYSRQAIEQQARRCSDSQHSIPQKEDNGVKKKRDLLHKY